MASRSTDMAGEVQSFGAVAVSHLSNPYYKLPISLTLNLIGHVKIR